MAAGLSLDDDSIFFVCAQHMPLYEFAARYCIGMCGLGAGCRAGYEFSSNSGSIRSCRGRH
jgi:hypothetical protein